MAEGLGDEASNAGGLATEQVGAQRPSGRGGGRVEVVASEGSSGGARRGESESNRGGVTAAVRNRPTTTWWRTKARRDVWARRRDCAAAYELGAGSLPRLVACPRFCHGRHRPCRMVRQSMLSCPNTTSCAGRSWSSSSRRRRCRSAPAGIAATNCFRMADLTHATARGSRDQWDHVITSYPWEDSRRVPTPPERGGRGRTGH
jgi:hypothetical protein